MDKNRRSIASKPRKRKNKTKGNKRYRIIILIVLFVLISSVFLITYDHFIRSRRGDFHSFHDNVYEHKYFVRGVDISHHNELFDWNILKDEGITFVYLKATEDNSHLDRDYADNYVKAKQAGLTVGTYHFYRFAMDGKQQAQHFINTAKVRSGDLIPAIDVEHSNLNRKSNDEKYIQKVVDELLVLENELYMHYEVRPIIYTNKSCYKLYIEENFPHNLIWMCDLHKEPALENDKWIIWQFSHTGKIVGIDKDVDLNYFRYSFRKFNELLMH